MVSEITEGDLFVSHTVSMYTLSSSISQFYSNTSHNHESSLPYARRCEYG